MKSLFSKALQSLGRHALSLVWLLLWVSACNTNGLVGNGCAEGFTTCGQSCVNLRSDEQHCGQCGNQCDNGERCRSGRCAPGSDTTDVSPSSSSGDSSSSKGSDSETTLTSDVVDAGDSSTGRTETGETSEGASTGPDGGFLEPCFPPYNSAEHCGACDSACPASMPFCAPTGDTFHCVSGCREPLLLCADRCTDVTSDPRNCGECGNTCPTGICRDSECVGGQAGGHLVAMCMSFEQLYGDSPQGVLLANAVFLATGETTNVVLFDAFAPTVVKNRMRTLIRDSGAARGRRVTVNVAASVDEVSLALQSNFYDVLVIADTSLARVGSMRDMGRVLAPAMDAFTRSGGVVVVTSGSGATQMPDFWNSRGTNLLDVQGVPDITFEELYNRAPADALAANVLTPFLALTSTCVFELADPGPDTQVIITGKDPNGVGELPVVLHRVMLP
jgi:hypothetical protein